MDEQWRGVADDESGRSGGWPGTVGVEALQGEPAWRRRGDSLGFRRAGRGADHGVESRGEVDDDPSPRQSYLAGAPGQVPMVLVHETHSHVCPSE